METLQVAEPLLQGSTRIRVSREAAKLIASAGRAAVIWLPVYALLTRHVASLSSLIVLSLVVTAVWFLALRAAFAAARLTLLALGPTVAAAIGTVTGLATVSALNLWVPGMQLGPQTMMIIVGSVFVLSAAWEALVYRSIAGRSRVLIVGASDGGADLVEALSLAEDAPFEIVGLVDDERESDQIAGVPLHGRIATCRGSSRRNGPISSCSRAPTSGRRPSTTCWTSRRPASRSWACRSSTSTPSAASPSGT